jgi:hypothetical protein
VIGQEKPSPQGWYSPEYNSASPSTATIWNAGINGTSTFIWVLWPSEGKTREVEVNAVPAENGMKVTVRPEGENTTEVFVKAPGKF